ncbi:glycosyltransferase [Solibacillus sp. CAU 1738]|uniref:glycosyltransferase n=1 Tax=Solibacillus sp. CAU 1738 TaxID=3140363 RepID=UPI0032607761
MNILHIIPTLGVGGAEKLLVDSLKYYRQSGVICDVAVLSNHDNIFEENIRQQGNALFISTENSVYHLRNILFIKKVIQNKQYDVIHCHLYAAQLFTPIALKFCRHRPLLVTTEHSTSNRRRNILPFKMLDRKMYNNYDKIICISNAVQLELEKYIPTLSSKTLTIENGIEIEPFVNACPVDWENELEHYDGEKIVLMVASLRHQKDPFTLIKAAKVLGTEYRVVFAGDGELLHEAKRFAHSQNISNVDFLGKRQDIPSLMKAADVFVLSSKWEGFGLVVVEAAVAGVPIVTSNVSGLRDVVKSVGGQLFEPSNVYDLTKKIETSINTVKHNPNISRYDIKDTVTKHLNLYKECKK